ncbi:MAG: hypothetical protein H6740_24635 [Alphaproteobacteria bacterium]|nr:hypothetical protein [Alphaproteobacteria bacterium]
MEVLNWNGQDLPEELRELPAGRYELRPASDSSTLTPEQDAGLIRGLRELDEGQGVPHDEVVARWRDRLGE